jgi:hypothetical protein
VSQQAVRVGADGLQVQWQPQVQGGTLQSPEMLLERERLAVVDPDYLKRSITA